MSNHATAIAFLFLLAAVPLHAQVTVKDYRAASTNDPANLLVQTYIKGLGEGIMLANLEAEKARTEADGECLDTNPAELGYDEMSTLVHHDDRADKDDKCSGRYQKFMHRCASVSFG